MAALDLINEILPDHFDQKTDGTPEERAQHLVDQCFPGATGMQIDSLTGDLATASSTLQKKNMALHGLMHGGAYFTIGDTLTALMCIFHVTKPRERMLTVNASIRYLRPISEGTMLSKARLSKKEGNILSFVCDFYNSEGKRAAQARFKYALIEI